jgi:Calpain family cysteine protease
MPNQPGGVAFNQGYNMNTNNLP